MIHTQVKKWRKIIKFRIVYGMTVGMVDYQESSEEWVAEVHPPAGSWLSVETVGSRRTGIHGHYTVVLSDIFKNDKLELVK